MKKLLTLAVVAALTVAAAPAGSSSTIDLPEGVAPEGIVSGQGSTFYVGSLAGGQIVKGDLGTRTIDSFVTDPALPVAVGLAYSEPLDLLVAAGGPTGAAAFYDADTGDLRGLVELGQGFINDAVFTRDAAYLTNSAVAEIYRVPIERDGGIGTPETIALSGPAAELPGAFNLNGIEAARGGRTLIAVNSTSGALVTIDPRDGSSELIEGVSTPNGDGILLSGRTLYVVQNQLNQVAVIQLSERLTSGDLVGTITADEFNVPTTIGRIGGKLLLVNAQFGVPPEVDSTFEVVIVDKGGTRSG